MGVSIPFIAGQWSLPEPWLFYARQVVAFQSPSLRGSGRFAWWRAAQEASARGFNPLHCGAVVASRGARATPSAGPRVSIPFIAGQWSLRAAQRRGRWPSQLVSIPFIAGQWSLRARRRRGAPGPPCLNPLHCGAVVASRHYFDPPVRVVEVSIPFIAGQWSLPHLQIFVPGSHNESQSPSLRGSGRFTRVAGPKSGPRGTSQSPSLRGSGRFKEET